MRSWAPDGSGFYYTRYPHEGERSAEDMHFYQHVYLHLLGSKAASDRYVLGRDFPRIAETPRRKVRLDYALFAPLERQVKPGQSSKKKGACHVNCSYDM